MPKGDNAGRKLGSYALDEPKSKSLELMLTPTAYAWLKQQKRGWLGKLVEEWARGERKLPNS
jgi:hypothetical protein